MRHTAETGRDPLSLKKSSSGRARKRERKIAREKHISRIRTCGGRFCANRRTSVRVRARVCVCVYTPAAHPARPRVRVVRKRVRKQKFVKANRGRLLVNATFLSRLSWRSVAVVTPILIVVVVVARSLARPFARSFLRTLRGIRFASVSRREGHVACDRLLSVPGSNIQ